MRALLALAFLNVAWPVHAADPAKYMRAELVAGTTRPKPGTTILIGFRMTPSPGWHGYWSNPGDSGIAPSVRWDLPRGVTAGALLHPAPTLLLTGGIGSFVHTGPHVLLSRLHIAPSLAAGSHIPLKAELDWAACTATQCVPLRQVFSLELVAGDGAPSADAALLHRAVRKVPRTDYHGKFLFDGRQLQLLFPAALRLDARRALFFPDDNDTFDTAKGSSSEKDGALSIAGPALRTPKVLSGVVSDGVAAYHVLFSPSPIPARLPKAERGARAALGEDVADGPPTMNHAVAPTKLVRPDAQQREPQGRAWEFAILAAAASVALLAAAAMLRGR